MTATTTSQPNTSRSANSRSANSRSASSRSASSPRAGLAPGVAGISDPADASTGAVLGPGRARILGGPPSTSLAQHEARYGRIDPRRLRGLIPEVESAELRGRGGAGFPTHIKMAAVASNSRRGLRSRSPVIVANGTESEPASAKDTVLLRAAPHLVLDGIMAAAAAVRGAARSCASIERTAKRCPPCAGRSPNDPRTRSRSRSAEAPSRYVAGEETALVSWINGRESRPTFSPPRPVQRGVGGAPTLVDNVETLAHVALVARFGGEAFRQVGEPGEAGTMLVTLRGGVEAPGVYEVPIGTPITDLLEAAGAGRAAGVLVGGYFGTWLRPDQSARAAMSRRSLEGFGAFPGCGLVAVIPELHCPLQEVSAVLRWLASNSAGQCGACVNGLPAISAAFEALAAGDPTRRADAALDRWSPMVAGRGACKLPDGAVSFMLSARRTFAPHVELHRVHGACPRNPCTILPTPALDGWR